MPNFLPPNHDSSGDVLYGIEICGTPTSKASAWGGDASGVDQHQHRDRFDTGL
ncbi:hypothetical protein N9F58_02060 [Akkermansiaceae bacterium]|nr:hypothetical protein [Akkermansiaceae bacterium]